MKTSELSGSINRELIEYELWLDEANNLDVEAFISERELSEPVAEGLRKIIGMELEVESMFQNTPTLDRPCASCESHPVNVGNFKLIRRLGSGGMGTVWLAQQERPVRRRVAIKLIKTGLNKEVFLQRFETERQTLASMAHPNIAKVLDAGASECDAPYFAMEYVQGKSITEYCNQNSLSLNSRLELFLQLCDGIQHAHQKGVLHRDIKPTNVLVANTDGASRVKIIDFGLSKIMNGQNPDLTQTQAAVGSPLWMSPEQARGRTDDPSDWIDTRSDIYSLGIILYQLLTNTTPITKEFFLKESPLTVLDAIHNDTPPYPSARICQSIKGNSWISESTKSSFSRWKNNLEDDLDWITMKAIEKDRERRYPTVTALSDDIKRFVAGEPVVARPPSTVYRFKKLIRKHRAATTAAIAMTLTLAFATLVSSHFATRSNADRKTAESASRILGHAIYSTFNVANTNVTYDPLLTNEMKRIAKEVEQLDFSQPMWEAESGLKLLIAKSLADNGNHRHAITTLKGVVQLNETNLGREHRNALIPKILLARQFFETGKSDESLRLATECIESWKKLPGDNEAWIIKAEAMQNLALVAKSKWSTVVSNLERQLPKIEDRLGSYHPDCLFSAGLLAQGYARLSRFKEALEVASSFSVLANQHLGPDHEDTLGLEFIKFQARTACGEKPDTKKIEKLLARLGENLGEGNSFTIKLRAIYVMSLYELAVNTNDSEMMRKALQFAETNVSFCSKEYGEDGLLTANTLDRLAFIQSSLGQFDKALTNYRKAKSVFEKQIGQECEDVLRCNFLIADIFADKQDWSSALEIVSQTIPIAESSPSLGPADILTLDMRCINARCLIETGDIDSGIVLLEENVKRSRETHGWDRIDTGRQLLNLGQAMSRNRRFAEAIENLEEALMIFEMNLEPNHQSVIRVKQIVAQEKFKLSAQNCATAQE